MKKLQKGMVLLIVCVFTITSSSFTFANTNSVADNTIIASGKCGEQLTWEITEDGILTISGTGSMYNYSMHINDMPWNAYKSIISKLVVKDGVTGIGEDAFSYSSVKKVELPNSLTTINSAAFYACTSLEDINIPDSVAYIGRGAFSGATSLQSITIPSNVEFIGDCTFSTCYNLTNIIVDSNNNNYMDMDGVLFSKDGSMLHSFPCGKEGSYTIPNVTSRIGEYAFRYATKLTEIKSGDNLQYIEDGAFSFCEAMKTLDIGSNIIYLGDGIAEGCINLQNIFVDNNNASFCDVDGVLFNKDKTSLLMYPAGRKDEYIIPYGVAQIERNAFNSTLVTSVVIPDSVVSIGDNAFRCCYNICEITIPKSVNEIGQATFECCTNLSKANFETTNVILHNNIFRYAYEDLIIYCHKDTAVEEYAKSNYLNYEVTEHVEGAQATCTADQVCSICEAVLNVATGHDYTSEIITLASCEKDGVMTYTCKNDSTHTYTEAIPATGHDYTSEITTPASCEKDGVMTYTCKNDSTHTYTEAIPATGHDYTSEITTPASCEKDGVMTYTCKNDSTHTYTEAIPATGHGYTSEITTSASCEKDGVMTYTCKNDSTHTYTEAIPATGHSYSSYKTTKKAGFGIKGTQTSTCQNDNCTSKKTKTIPALKTPILSTTTYTFNNKVKKPTVTVKNTSGTSISKSVSYASGRKNVGKYALKVTVNNANYKGTKTVYFKINPAKPTSVKLTKGKKQFKVSWAKPNATYRKQIDGYQVRYATSSSKLSKAKPVTVKGSSVTSKTIKNLKAKKKYYVQVRTYKTVKGVKYYSNWTTNKYVTTK